MNRARKIERDRPELSFRTYIILVASRHDTGSPLFVSTVKRGGYTSSVDHARLFAHRMSAKRRAKIIRQSRPTHGYYFKVIDLDTALGLEALWNVCKT